MSSVLRQEIGLRLTLVSGAVSLAIFLAFGLILLRDQFRFSQVLSQQNSSDLLSQVMSDQSKAETIDPHGISQLSRVPELAAPETNLPRFFDYPKRDLIALYRYAESCKSEPGSVRSASALKKAWTWHEFLCGKLKSLPKAFFISRPYLHPSGASYVLLALENAPKSLPPNLRGHLLPYVHLSELSQVSRLGIPLSGPYELLSGLKPGFALRMARGQPAILDGRYFFLKRHPQEAGSPAYSVFPRPTWETNSRSWFIETTASGRDCHELAKGICWKPDSKRFDKSVRFYRKCLSVSGLTFLFCTLWLGALLFFRRYRLQKARRFMLEVLTHEIRSPTASIRLGLEELHSSFDQVPPEVQDSIVDIGDDIIRLQRVVDASAHYLTSRTGRRNLELAPSRIESIRRAIEAVLEPHSDRVERVYDGQDTAIDADPYWLQVCMGNLVTNAIQYGHPPILVRSFSKNGRTYVTIENRGQFADGKKGNGLGLGLIITSELIREMGGTFKLTKSPKISCEVSFPTRSI